MHISQAHKDKVDPSLLNTPADCNICNKQFASYVDLEQHKDDAHKTPAPVPAVPTPTPTPTRPTHHYYCPFSNCDYYGYTEEDVHQHQKSRHWHDYIYRCNKCKFVSDNIDDLGMHHTRVHLGPFVPIGKSVILPCNLCQYNANCWTNFFTHMRTHTQNKYPCAECQFTFTSPLLLNKHSVYTHDTRHFGCGFCILDFPNNDELCVQAPTHQITCFLCWELFMSDQEFNKHMEKKHPTKQMTIQQTRSAEEEREWEDRQRVKAMKQLKREHHREQEEDRKRRLYGETSDPVPGTSSESPKKKCRRSKPPTRPTQMRMTTMVKNLQMTTNSIQIQA